MDTNKLKRAVILFFISIVTLSIKAQDLIVTSEGDSINCKITKVSKENIYFTFVHKNETRSTLISTNQIKQRQFNYFQTSDMQMGKVIGREVYPRFRVALNGGWSYRLGKISDDIPSDFKQYTRELKSGYHYGLDLSYYFSEIFGAGLKLGNHQSKNKLSNIYLAQSAGYGNTVKISDNMTTSFIGPFFSTRFLNADKKNSLLLNLLPSYDG